MNRNQSLAVMVGLGAAAYVVARALAPRGTFDFRGKTVVITGGSRGLGLVMARQLVRRGARVAICARDAATLERAAQQLRDLGGEVYSQPCDVSRKPDVDAFISAVERRFGRIDVLINNAGLIQVGPESMMTIADYEEAMGVSFWGPLYMIRAVLPGMRRQHAGRIVNIASIGGKVAIPHLSPYCAGKFALVGLSESLHVELAGEDIVVTTVCPHLMRTGSPPNATFKGKHQAEYAWFSIGDSLPFISEDAETSAESILNACQQGEAEVTLSLQANTAARLYAFFPGLCQTVLGWVNQLLPGPGGVGPRRMTGRQSYSALSPSWLTTLGNQAARRNNEQP